VTSGLGVLVSGFGIKVSVFGFPECRASGWEFQVSNFEFRGVGYPASDLGVREPGCGFRGWGALVVGRVQRCCPGRPYPHSHCKVLVWRFGFGVWRLVVRVRVRGGRGGEGGWRKRIWGDWLRVKG
jgi:hypothetical protein